MDTSKFLAEVEAEIARLQRVADALRGVEIKVAGRGARARHTMSAAARRKISLAQKARWAKVRSKK